MWQLRHDELTKAPAAPVVGSRGTRWLQLLTLVLATALLLAMVAEVAGVFGAAHSALDFIVPIAALPLLALTLLLYRQRTSPADDVQLTPTSMLPLPHVTHRSAPAPLSDPFAAA